ncbi:MAG: hypothetical protein WBP76_05295 [Leptotrichiaceae bacterium]|jgi:hypothetical protein|nr:hypothetical protein [Leptotrichiaceae bacterium]MBP6167643.1 hypothetical protein [Leptotrichiaceae bacterium]MBP7026595.1 hypothetical protein [Leptotrichiaceae bacterium]MBP8637244.1 hypothetical protein [Leptotrichiaceae bacterium]MBP9538575.1 hypothetical protein [Leptotrichiaceae bacterium]
MEINNDEAFIKKAVNYSRIVFIISIIQNIFLMLLIGVYFLTLNSEKNETMSMILPISFLLLISILYILHLISAMTCLFLNMSNILAVMKIENVSGHKELKIASILAIFPVTSFVASVFAFNSMKKIKDRINK